MVIGVVILSTGTLNVRANEPDADDDNFVVREIAKREAQPIDDVRKEYKDGCASGVTSSMRTCIHYHRIAGDILVNRYYPLLLKKLGKSPAAEKLIRAQRAWLAYRDANCAYESVAYVAPEYRDFSDPSDKREVVAACLSALTDERVKWLKDYAACPTIVCSPDN